MSMFRSRLALHRLLADLWQKTPQIARYERVRVSEAGILESQGFSLVPSFAAPHYSIVLPGELTDEIWEKLDGAFLPATREP